LIGIQYLIWNTKHTELVGYFCEGWSHERWESGIDLQLSSEQKTTKEKGLS